VATDWPGCTEVVKNGHNGFLCIPNNIKSLSESILKLLSDKTLCLEMGRKSRRIAEAEFSEASVVEKTFNIYDLS